MNRAFVSLKPNLVMLALLLLSASDRSNAGDIGNGWSDVTTIIETRNHSGVIDIRLSSNIAGCGTPGDSASYWRVVIDSSEVSKHRRSTLLAAYLSGKRVQLRCESSVVSDFVVTD